MEHEKAEALKLSYRRGCTPPPRISVPEWADRYRKLAKEAGSTSGSWRTRTVEVARGPMLAVTEPGVHIITVMVSTQLLKTSLLENVFGYFAHLDPCPMLLLQPKEDAAEQFSKERITPMVRCTPVLRELIGTSKTRNKDETLLFKAFPGGFLALAGAGSPDNLARRPVRLVLADEIDKYPVTREGDPIALAEERTATFGLNWLSVRACSPTVDDESRIAASYLEGDQRRASVSCPHCGHRQFLDFFKHVEWEKSESGQHLPETAKIFCERCGAGWSEGERLRALETVRWHQTRQFHCCGALHIPLDEYDRAWRDGKDVDDVWLWSESDRHAVYYARCPECGDTPVSNEHASFQASKMYSPWQKDRPVDIAKKWLAAKGDEEKKQTFYNTQLGLPYRQHSSKEIRPEGIAARGEVWAADVPDGVAVVTCGVDVQDYRVEVETIGWGRNEESWSIDYTVLDGEFEDPDLQRRLDAHLMRKWHRADGRAFEVMAACIDSGGHHTQQVYNFAKARLGRRIWAIKGESARNGQRNPVWPTKRPTSRTKKTYRPVIIGVNAAKDTVRSRLALLKHGAGYMHFPADRDINYYAQLTAEHLVVKVQSGKKFRVWVLPPGRANEALDCRVYGYAALCGLMHFGLQLNRRVEAVSPPPAASTAMPVLEQGEPLPRHAANHIPPKELNSPEPPPKKRSLISRLA